MGRKYPSRGINLLLLYKSGVNEIELIFYDYNSITDFIDRG